MAAQPQAVQQPNYTEEIIRRTRILEERYNNLRKKEQFVEQSLIGDFKKVNAETKSITLDLHEIRREIDEIKQKLTLVVRELQLSAKQEEVNTLSRYIDFWQPMKFITEAEVEKIIQQKIEDYHSANHIVTKPKIKPNEKIDYSF